MTWSLDFHSSQSLFKQILFLNHPRSDSTLLNQKMSVLALSNSLPTLPPSPSQSQSQSETPKPLSPLLSNFTTTIHNNSISWTKKTIITALSGALSFGLVFSPPCSVALESPTIQSPPSPSSEYCREDEQVLKAESGPELVTNAGIVEEAWEIVNDSFLGTGRHRWSPQTWQVTILYSIRGLSSVF